MRYFMIGVVSVAFLCLLSVAASGAEREFDVYCKDLESAAGYAEGLYRQDAVELNYIIESEMCGFFSDHFGGSLARGEVMKTKVLGDTGYVAEYIRFPNNIKVITVTREGL